MSLWIWIAIAAVFFLLILPMILIAVVLYLILFVRTSKNKWGRVCSFPEDEEYSKMYDTGLEWGKKYEQHKTPVDIQSGRYRLCGEYFDFGGKCAVIIIAGRTEACYYGYYFAEPYRQLGCNVLVIDNRAHGLSDGRVTSFGMREYKDIINWGRFLHDEKHNEKVILHGICIGASAAIFAITDKTCPDYISALTVEGMFPKFYDSFINNMKTQKRKPIQPVAFEVGLLILLFSHANIITNGPKNRVGQLKKPILFLHSREDKYSLPEKAQMMYDECDCEKQLVWFEHGEHSRLRIIDEKKYDKAIVDFYSQLYYN
ncbi:MAG: lysophospholipase [Ruminococcus sp.]|nr:lysophospholipase [Ruminococcus sp.]